MRTVKDMVRARVERTRTSTVKRKVMAVRNDSPILISDVPVLLKYFQYRLYGVG